MKGVLYYAWIVMGVSELTSPANKVFQLKKEPAAYPVILQMDEERTSDEVPSE